MSVVLQIYAIIVTLSLIIVLSVLGLIYSYFLELFTKS